MSEKQRRFAARRQLWEQTFKGIELEGKTVLDAGTGEGYFTRFLAERQPQHLVSITCVPEEIEPARKIVGDLSEHVKFQVADLTAMTDVPDASFDLVAGDFLIAAVWAYSPYREIECLKELIRVLRPGGRLILTGWESAEHASRQTQTEQRIRRLFKLRDAIHALAGTDAFREHPRFWIENRLMELGMPPERFSEVPDVHYDFDWFVHAIRRILSHVGPDDLHQALESRLQEIQADLTGDSALAAGYQFGRLYSVVACKLEGALLL